MAHHHLERDRSSKAVVTNQRFATVSLAKSQRFLLLAVSDAFMPVLAVVTHQTAQLNFRRQQTSRERVQDVQSAVFQAISSFPDITTKAFDGVGVGNVFFAQRCL